MTMTLVGKRLGNYDIQSQIGEGGMGAVYLGHHPTIGKRVAIKVLHEELCEKPDVVNRFFNEAKAVNDISHPNIVDIIDFGDTTFDGKAVKYIIMEFLDGESLASRIRREGVTIRESLQIIAQTASALSASHAKGVIHRDLKPENVFLCNRQGDRNYVKLLDFGIAKLTSDTGALSQKTRTGMVIGTPTYMSPEQCDGKGQIDARADVYALGVMMYELFTGRVPFPGDGFGEVLVAHLTREPEPPRSINPNIPPELEAIVLRCMRKRKEERFQSMNDLLAAVADPGPHYQTFLQGAPAPTASGTPIVLPSSGPLPLLPSAVPMAGQPGVAQLAAGGQPPMRSPSAVWAVVNPNLPPAMQQMQMQQMQQQVQQMQQMGMMPSGPAIIQPMQMGPGGQPVATGMMIAPGMPSDMLAVQGAGGVPRATTLSGAPAEQSGRRPINVLVGFVGAMLIGALIVVGARMATSRGTSPSAPPPPEPVISITVKTDPEGAEVFRSDADTEVGKTPYAFKIMKGGKPVDIKVRLAGYREEARTIHPSEDQLIDIGLTKEVPSDPPPASDAAAKGRHVRAQAGTELKDPTGKPGKELKDPEGKLGKLSKDPKAKDGTAKDPAEKPKRRKGSGDGVIRPIF